MNNKMKSIVAAILLTLTAHLTAQVVEINPPEQIQPTQQIDAKFLALALWHAQLNSAARAYNAQCAGNEAHEGCLEIKAVLTEQMKYFVTCANRYKDLSGDQDCKAALRPAIIKTFVDSFNWNIECMDVHSAQCGERQAKIDKERNDVQAKVNTCGGEEKTL